MKDGMGQDRPVILAAKQRFEPRVWLTFVPDCGSGTDCTIPLQTTDGVGLFLNAPLSRTPAILGMGWVRFLLPDAVIF